MVIEISCRLLQAVVVAGWKKVFFRFWLKWGSIWKTSQTERLVNYNWPSMVRASKWAHKRHSFCTPPRAGFSNWARWKLQHSTFRGKLPEGLLLSRGPSRRDHIMVLWIFEITKLKNLKPRMKEERWRKASPELVFHTRLLLLTFREFHIKPRPATATNGWGVVWENDLCVRCVKNGNYCCSRCPR